MNNDNDLNLHLSDQMSGWLRYYSAWVSQKNLQCTSKVSARNFLLSIHDNMQCAVQCKIMSKHPCTNPFLSN